jgi:hypothetical protein
MNFAAVAGARSRAKALPAWHPGNGMEGTQPAEDPLRGAKRLPETKRAISDASQVRTGRLHEIIGDAVWEMRFSIASSAADTGSN